MASVVDICNIALARLGDEATVTSIDPSEGSAQADHCARFYPQARDTLLQRHPWSFATRRARLARLAETPPGASCAWALPASCLKVLECFEDGEAPAGRPWVHGMPHLHWRVEMLGEQRVILAEAESLNIVYLSGGTKPELYPALFTEALSWLLASMLAGAIVKDQSGQQLAANCMRFYEDAFQKAVSADAQQQRESIHFVPVGLEDYARAC